MDAGKVAEEIKKQVKWNESKSPARVITRRPFFERDADLSKTNRYLF